MRVIQDLAVGSPQRFREFRHRLALNFDVRNSVQRDETIGLNRNRLLIELGAEFEINVERVPRFDVVTRIARVEFGIVSTTRSRGRLIDRRARGGLRLRLPGTPELSSHHR